MKEPKFVVGQPVADKTGNYLGVIQHSTYSEQRGWQYTISNSMSKHSGQFMFVSENNLQLAKKW